ncbi:MAG: helix-turn-helix domain-containing protein [Vibrionaceae bacterium]
MADDILTQLRERMQLTQAQLAAALCVTQPTINLKNRFK